MGPTSKVTSCKRLSIPFRPKRTDMGVCIKHAICFAVVWTVEVPFQVITPGIPDDEMPLCKRDAVPSLRAYRVALYVNFHTHPGLGRIRNRYERGAPVPFQRTGGCCLGDTSPGRTAADGIRAGGTTQRLRPGITEFALERDVADRAAKHA